MIPGKDVRADAASAVADIAGRGRSLDRSLDKVLPAWRHSRDRAMLQALTYGVARFYPRLERLLEQLLDKPLRPRDLPLKCLLMTGLYQVSSMRVPDHAAVSATVSAAAVIGRRDARGLVNAVLRRYVREQDAIDAAVRDTPEGRWAHPAWMVERIARDWPDQWQSVLEANNQHPPMWLRVNRSRIERETWLTASGPDRAVSGQVAPESVLLAVPCDVESIDGFARGEVSVQDAGAQLAAHLLEAQAGDRVLDACAAPGGKAAHILELCPAAHVDALELDPRRLAAMRTDMTRLGLAPRLLQGDARRPEDWWDGMPYDRVLVDAPCTASGVIRRHPDIKLLRRETDVASLARSQAEILDALWRVLRPGGRLVYSTCSIFPEENSDQIGRILEKTPDAVAGAITGLPGVESGAGWQVLPGDAGMDGFYYACLTKGA